MQASHRKLGYYKTRDLADPRVECERSEIASCNVFKLVLVQSLKTDDEMENQIYKTI